MHTKGTRKGKGTGKGKLPKYTVTYLGEMPTVVEVPEQPKRRWTKKELAARKTRTAKGVSKGTSKGAFKGKGKGKGNMSKGKSYGKNTMTMEWNSKNGW
eukprot:2558189-Lingulodinium_polyedra.AAC.1